MKKSISGIILLLGLWLSIAVGAQAQATSGNYPTGASITVQEADGSPKVVMPTKIIFPNGSLSTTGKTVTVTFSGGGGGTWGSITGTLADQSDLQTALNARATKPASSDYILYVSPNGNNSNDGLSWGTAKQTIAAAIALLPSTGGTINLSAGTHTVSARLSLINKSGFIIQGAGKDATQIQPSGLGGDDVFRLSNVRDATIRDLRILGAGGANKPAAAIRIRVEPPDNVTSANVAVTNVLIGSDSSNSFSDGIVIDYDTTPLACGGGTVTCDHNNEQHTFTDVEVRNVSTACYSIAGINSEWHKIIGGQCTGAKNFVRTNGGNFKLWGSNAASLGISDPVFAITGGTLGAGPISVKDLNVESANYLLTTDTSQTHVILDGLIFNGGAGALATIIDWDAGSGSDFRMSNSKIMGGGIIDFGGSGYVFLEGNKTDGNSSFVFGSNHAYRIGQNEWGDGTLPGGGLFGIRRITSSTTALPYVDTYLVDATSGAVTLTLPPIGNLRGKRYTVKKIDTSSNAVTVAADTGETIETVAGATASTTVLPGGARSTATFEASATGTTVWYATVNNPALLGGDNTFTGASIFKKASDSTTAFQVQNAAGTSQLNVDTSNGRVGIGTAAPTQRLHVAAGNLRLDYGYNVRFRNGTDSGDVTVFQLVNNNELQLGDVNTGAIVGVVGGVERLRLGSSGSAILGGAAANPPVAQTLAAQNASGTNIAGADFTIAGSRGTGTGAAGKLNFQVAPTGSSGASLNTLTTVMQLDASTTSGDTRLLLWDVDAGTLKRVSVGASDSCGTGYRCLRIAN